jgi:AcrR family transcriptional regulator
MSGVQQDRPARGGRASLTIDRIVTAGIAVAVSDGLAALSMSRIAAELGVAAMSLYHHVGSKDLLVALMVDGALGRPPAIPLREHWRAGLAAWAHAQLAAYRRHPWMLQVVMTAPPMGRNHLAWLECALRCLAGTPLTEQQKLSTTLLISGHVRTQAGLPTDMAAPAPTGPAGPSYGQTLSDLIDAVAFPALHQAIASGALDDQDGLAGEFDFGLGVILNGIDTLIATATATATGQRPPTR